MEWSSGVAILVVLTVLRLAVPVLLTFAAASLLRRIDAHLRPQPMAGGGE